MKYESNSVEVGGHVKGQLDPSIADLNALKLCVKKAVGVSFKFDLKQISSYSFIIYFKLCFTV